MMTYTLEKALEKQVATLEEAESERYCIDNGLIPDPYKWSEWCPTINIIPRKSITGRLLFGRMYKRSKTEHRLEIEHISGYGDQVPYKVHQFATKKDVFQAKLKGT